MNNTGRAGAYALDVDRKEFVKALKDIARFNRRGGGFVRFSYADGELAFAMPNVTIRVTAQGTWPTEITMSGGWAKVMARVPPRADPVAVTYDGHRVTVGTTVIPAVPAEPGRPPAATDEFDVLLDYAEAIFTASESTDTDARVQGIVKLRDLAKTNQAARDRLREFISADDGTVRFHAAEALSWTQSYPEEAIPVLHAVLSVCNERGRLESDRLWAGIALGALEHYGVDAIATEEDVWPYLYAQGDPALRTMAVRVLANLAAVSDASWTILCLLCHHEEPAVREQARAIMKGDEFASRFRHLRRKGAQDWP